jgi:hypothetical protein
MCVCMCESVCVCVCVCVVYVCKDKINNTDEVPFGSHFILVFFLMSLFASSVFLSIFLLFFFEVIHEFCCILFQSILISFHSHLASETASQIYILLRKVDSIILKFTCKFMQLVLENTDQLQMNFLQSGLYFYKFICT